MPVNINENNSKIELLMSGMRNLEETFRSLRHDESTTTPTDPLSVLENLFFSFKALVLSEINTLKDQTKKQDDRISHLEQYSRRNMLLIHGIDESFAQSEVDCVAVAVDVLSGKLGIDIQEYHIDRAHRIGKKIHDKKRPIIVKFVSYFHRRLVFSNKKKLKNTGIHITESLTQTNHNILTEARNIYSMNNVWTLDGRIMIKDGERKYTVTSMDQLMSLSVQKISTGSSLPNPIFSTPPPLNTSSMSSMNLNIPNAPSKNVHNQTPMSSGLPGYIKKKKNSSKKNKKNKNK